VAVCPATGGTGCVDAHSRRAPGCLPLTAPYQSPASHSARKADAAVEPLGRLPHGCITRHPAAAICLLSTWPVELAALWPPRMKGCSTSPLAEVRSALLPSLFAMPRCQSITMLFHPLPHVFQQISASGRP